VPDYDFRTLSPVDFEHLARDVLNADLGLTLQGYTPGRDQGIDLRQVAADGAVTVVQCKHYLDSSWSTFMRAVRREGTRGQELHADRYVFVTSRGLTPPQQDEVVGALRSLGVKHDHVWGRDMLNAALSRHPDVERRNVKLWLSSAGVLDTLLNAGRWQRGEATLDEVRDHAKLWVHTAAYDEVLNVLDHEGACIVYGPPGTGKTFLAEMVLLSAVAEGWSAVHISGDIEDAWRALLPNDTNQIFYYNDFLGESELQVASKNEPTQLAKFIIRIRRFREHKRLIMTTREQILWQAGNEYDALCDLLGDPQQLGVRLDKYPTRVRAEILFNHLYFSDMPQTDRERIALDNRIVGIIDHAAYNPRLIESALRFTIRGSADEKLEAIKKALDYPDRLWRSSFRMLSPLCQQVLLTMATLPARAWPLHMIRELVITNDRLGWRLALLSLESTWINVTGQPSDRYVAFANPSCRDYLLGVLDDAAVAEDQVERIRSLEQIVSLTRSAALLTDTASPVQRPELANAMRSRRDWLAELVRSRADADCEGLVAGESIQILRDAAAMLTVYGRESDTNWLMKRIQSLIESVGYSLAIDPLDSFILSEFLMQLASEAPERRERLAEKLVIEAINAIQTSRELDAYEMLLHELRTSAVQEAARQRASEVLAAEADHLLHDADDPRVVRIGAADIEQRAQWYSLEVNIGPLLDRAIELQAGEAQVSPWPNSEDDLEPIASTDDATDISQIFSRFAQ
jgi:hypothetical protein